MRHSSKILNGVKKEKSGHSQKPDEIEVEAKTAQEAIRIALTKLGVDRKDVDIKILREENKGLFSMHGSRLAKIKVIKKLQKK